MAILFRKKKANFFCLRHRVFLLLSILLDCYAELAVSHSAVASLPGFQGPLPFQLETGYVGVGESEDVQLFYYFVKSESNPQEDPLLLWLTGGPGCSAISGLLYEIGPLNFKAMQKQQSLPELVLNPNSWSKVEYNKDEPIVMAVLAASLAWLIDHPEFLSNPVYVGGDSYSGITVPIVVQLMSNGNEAGIEPYFNLKGYLLGNPLTIPAVESNYAIPFAHGMGFISDELYESLQRNCKGEYVNVDPSNADCLADVEAYTQCTDGVNHAQILEPSCGFARPKPWELFGKRRSLAEGKGELLVTEPSPCASSRVDGYRLSHSWLNNDSVREALRIHKGSIEEWIRCNRDLSYTATINESFQYHVNLSMKGYRSLIYSGDHDMIVPFLGTQAWIRALNYSIVNDWRSWVVDGQVAGYTRTYSNGMTFATVKGGGHTAPEYKPIECFSLFKRWISHQPL